MHDGSFLRQVRSNSAVTRFCPQCSTARGNHKQLQATV